MLNTSLYSSISLKGAVSSTEASTKQSSLPSSS
ncbi:Uncharacterised protein [Vibrio cholerae]|nr:Uncharacterised protein [Vibrio cholerae]CSB01641.1 Uncharacterised protein [Vibrio cholerae]CSD19754.1 Uncharacterised protein [Vibrio cholerae]CSD24131.1 Uncharacterised protein [Vibrio cholerae]